MPKREDVDEVLKRMARLCGYCVHSTENLPKEELKGVGRLWCTKKQRIVMEMESAKKCPYYEI
ncbi:MAG: hypothetical protein DRI36_05620 [Caldiserica bacterium]|nr:MAG: hypothetical protein DRI36_05620 [Caldisericota bacterium]